jgi:dephospho-CoA kinase
VVAPGTPGLAEVVEAFGEGVLTADGSLDRKAMRERVFADPDARRRLERIVHPRVRHAMQDALGNMRGSYFLVVIPLLVESGDFGWVDRVLVVDVDRPTQIARLLKRDGITPELAEAMLDAQATREQRLAVADDVIENTSDLESLDAAVDALHERYLVLAD